MKTLISRSIRIALSCCFWGVGIAAQDKLDMEQAIEMALAYDPRIDEKEAFVRQAEGLLQEAEGSEGLALPCRQLPRLATGVDGGFYEDGEETCSGDCEPRDDLYDVDDGLSLWGGLTFSHHQAAGDLRPPG